MKKIIAYTLCSLTLCCASAQNSTPSTGNSPAQEPPIELNAAQRKLFNDIHTFLIEERVNPTATTNEIVFKSNDIIYHLLLSDVDDAPLYVTLGASYRLDEAAYSFDYLLQTAGLLNYNKGVKMIPFEGGITVQGEFYLKEVDPFRYVFHRTLHNIQATLSEFDEVYQIVSGNSTSTPPETTTTSGTTTSSSTTSGTSGKSVDGRTSNQAFEVANPSITTKSDARCFITNVQITDKETILTFESFNKQGKSSYDWASLSPYASLSVKGILHRLIRAEGIELEPKKTHYPSADSSIKFKLYFAPIPKTTQTIDFYEYGRDGWWFEGIKLNP